MQQTRCVQDPQLGHLGAPPGARTGDLGDLSDVSSLGDLSRWLVEASPDGLWVFDDEGHTVLANARMAAMLGRSPEEMPGLSVFETLDEEGQAQFEHHLKDLETSRESGSNLECSLLRKDGERFWALVSHTPINDDDGHHVGWLHRVTEYSQQRRLIDLSEASEDYKRVSAAKLDALLGLCETAGCRRVRLLDYFGETSTPCGNCDTCVAPPETFDATAAAQKALSAIYRTGQRFGAVHLIDVLRGKPGDRIARWDHDKLSVFGIGADLDETAWRVIFRQLVALGFARVDHTAHGALRLTEASRPLLRGDQQVAMRRAVARPRSSQRASRFRDGHEGAITAGDAALFERLKAWRLSEARAQSVPAFVILHDKTLADIARQRPRNLASLGSVSGIGAKKLERYGPALVELIGQVY